MRTFPYDRPVDNRPASIAYSDAGKVVGSDIPGRIQIGVQRKTARSTAETALAFAAAAINLTATTTLLAGVPWVNRNNGQTVHFSFVLDEATKLGEAPTVQSTALLFAGLYTRSNVGQIFQYDRSALFNRLNHAFRKYMIAISAETVNLSTKLLQMSLRGFGAFRLKGSTKPEVPGFDFTPMFAAKELILTGDRGLANPEVDADGFSSVLWFWKFFLENYMQPESILTIFRKFSRTNFPIDTVLVVLGNIECKSLSAVKSCNRRVSIQQTNRCGSGIVPDSTTLGLRKRNLTPLSLERLSGLQRFSSFHSCGNYQLGREIRKLAFGLVCVVVKFNAINSLLTPTRFAYAVKRVGVFPSRLTENFNLFLRWVDSQLDGQLHRSYTTVDGNRLSTTKV